MKAVFREEEIGDLPDIRIRNARPALQAPPTVNTRRRPAVA
jgi:hypothetical protein